MLVVMIDELAEDRFEMGTMEHQHPIETLPTNGTDEPLSERGRGDRTGVRRVRMRSVRNTSSKPAVNFVSRSRIKNFVERDWSARTKLKLRACWVSHSPTGLAVMPLR